MFVSVVCSTVLFGYWLEKEITIYLERLWKSSVKFILAEQWCAKFTKFAQKFSHCHSADKADTCQARVHPKTIPKSILLITLSIASPLAPSNFSRSIPTAWLDSMWCLRSFVFVKIFQQTWHFNHYVTDGGEPGGVCGDVGLAASETWSETVTSKGVGVADTALSGMLVEEKGCEHSDAVGKVEEMLDTGTSSLTAVSVWAPVLQLPVTELEISKVGWEGWHGLVLFLWDRGVTGKFSDLEWEVVKDSEVEDKVVLLLKSL